MRLPGATLSETLLGMIRCQDRRREAILFVRAGSSFRTRSGRCCAAPVRPGVVRLPLRPLLGVFLPRLLPGRAAVCDPSRRLKARL